MFPPGPGQSEDLDIVKWPMRGVCDVCVWLVTSARLWRKSGSDPGTMGRPGLPTRSHNHLNKLSFSQMWRSLARGSSKLYLCETARPSNLDVRFWNELTIDNYIPSVWILINIINDQTFILMYLFKFLCLHFKTFCVSVQKTSEQGIKPLLWIKIWESDFWIHL